MRDSKLGPRPRQATAGLRLLPALAAAALGCNPPDYLPPEEVVQPDAAASTPAPGPARTASAPPTIPILYEGTYSLSAKHSGKCLDTRAATGHAQTFTCDSSSTQFFRIAPAGTGSRLTNLQGDACLEVEQASQTDLAKLKVGRCEGRPEQIFRIEDTLPGYVRLVVERSSKCVDVAGSGTAEGTSVQQYTCNATAAQDWLLTRTFVLRPHELRIKHSDRCLDLPGVMDGILAQQATCSGSGTQSFRMEARGRGLFAIVRQQGGLCVDVKSSGLADGAPVQQWTCNGTSAQFFRFQPLGGGHDRIVNENSGKCLQVAGARGEDGAAIEQATCTGADNQRWVARER